MHETWRHTSVKKMARQVMRGSIAMAGAQAVANIASFAIVWAVARGLGDESYGIFAAAYALATSVASLADSGVRMALVREVARTPTTWRRLWAYALGSSLILSIIVAAVFVGLILFVETLASQELRFWLLGYALLWTMMRITLGVPAGHHRLISVALWGAWERLAGAVLVAWLVFTDGTTLLILAQALCLLEAVILILLTLWIFLQKFPEDASLKTHPKDFIKIAVPFGVSAAAFAIMGRLDLIVLGFQQPPDVVGHYASAQLLAMIGVFVGIAAANALFPTLSQLGKTKDVAQSRRLIRPALGLLSLLMVALAMVVSSIAEDLLAYVYGDDFKLGAPWLILFALMAPIVAINSMAGSVIGAWGWQAKWAKFLWQLLPVIILFYGLAGLFNSIWGIALVGIGSQIVMALMAWRWMSREGIVDMDWLWRLMLLLLMAGILFWGLPQHMHWVLIPVSIVGVFAIGICRVSWIKVALRVVR
ncbi:MAG: oligosaccharide flippase family protein [Ghiorsea sp.]|nr:oligosaccharide flippase family protein [Ghiorsea sp.]